MTNPKLFLHIGLPKTGSTAVQEFLYRNRDELAKEGVFYPDLGIIDGAHHLIATSLITHLPPALQHLPQHDSDEIFRTLFKQLKESKCTTLLLSTEYFALLGFPSEARGRELLAQYLEKFSIEVIVYLRHQLPRYESTYSQEIRNARLGRPIYHADFFQDFIQRKGNHYTFLMQSWAETFGKSTLTIRPFDRATLTRQSIIYDMLALMDLPLTSSWSFPEAESNIALSQYRIELLNHLATLPLEDGFREQLYATISTLPLCNEEHEKTTILSASERDLLLSIYEADNRKLNTEYSAALNGCELEIDRTSIIEKQYEGMGPTFLDSLAQSLHNQSPKTAEELAVRIASFKESSPLLLTFAERLKST